MNKDFGFSGILGGKQSTNPGFQFFFISFHFVQRIFYLFSYAMRLNRILGVLQTFTIGIESKFGIAMVHLSPVI